MGDHSESNDSVDLPAALPLSHFHSLKSDPHQPSLPDREVSFLENPTLLSRLIFQREFSSALARLRTCPEEAAVWLTATRPRPESFLTNRTIHPPRRDSWPPTTPATPTLAGIAVALPHKRLPRMRPPVAGSEYSMKQLPLHMACHFLSMNIYVSNNRDPKIRTRPNESGNESEALEELIRALAITNPASCSKADHNGRLPLHEALFWKAPLAVVSSIFMAYPEALHHADASGLRPLEINALVGRKDQQLIAQTLLYAYKLWETSRNEAMVRYQLIGRVRSERIFADEIYHPADVSNNWSPAESGHEINGGRIQLENAGNKSEKARGDGSTRKPPEETLRVVTENLAEQNRQLTNATKRLMAGQPLGNVGFLPASSAGARDNDQNDGDDRNLKKSEHEKATSKAKSREKLQQKRLDILQRLESETSRVKRKLFRRESVVQEQSVDGSGKSLMDSKSYEPRLHSSVSTDSDASIGSNKYLENKVCELVNDKEKLERENESLQGQIQEMQRKLFGIQKEETSLQVERDSSDEEELELNDVGLEYYDQSLSVDEISQEVIEMSSSDGSLDAENSLRDRVSDLELQLREAEAENRLLRSAIAADSTASPETREILLSLAEGKAESRSIQNQMEEIDPSCSQCSKSAPVTPLSNPRPRMPRRMSLGDKLMAIDLLSSHEDDLLPQIREKVPSKAYSEDESRNERRQSCGYDSGYTGSGSDANLTHSMDSVPSLTSWGMLSIALQNTSKKTCNAHRRNSMPPSQSTIPLHPNDEFTDSNVISDCIGDPLEPVTSKEPKEFDRNKYTTILGTNWIPHRKRSNKFRRNSDGGASQSRRTSWKTFAPVSNGDPLAETARLLVAEEEITVIVQETQEHMVTPLDPSLVVALRECALRIASMSKEKQFGSSNGSLDTLHAVAESIVDYKLIDMAEKVYGKTIRTDVVASLRAASSSRVETSLQEIEATERMKKRLETEFLDVLIDTAEHQLHAPLPHKIVIALRDAATAFQPLLIEDFDNNGLLASIHIDFCQLDRLFDKAQQTIGQPFPQDLITAFRRASFVLQSRLRGCDFSNEVEPSDSNRESATTMIQDSPSRHSSEQMTAAVIVAVSPSRFMASPTTSMPRRKSLDSSPIMPHKAFESRARSKSFDTSPTMPRKSFDPILTPFDSSKKRSHELLSVLSQTPGEAYEADSVPTRSYATYGTNASIHKGEESQRRRRGKSLGGEDPGLMYRRARARSRSPSSTTEPEGSQRRRRRKAAGGEDPSMMCQKARARSRSPSSQTTDSLDAIYDKAVLLRTRSPSPETDEELDLLLQRASIGRLDYDKAQDHSVNQNNFQRMDLIAGLNTDQEPVHSTLGSTITMKEPHSKKIEKSRKQDNARMSGNQLAKTSNFEHIVLAAEQALGDRVTPQIMDALQILSEALAGGETPGGADEVTSVEENDSIDTKQDRDFGDNPEDKESTKNSSHSDVSMTLSQLHHMPSKTGVSAFEAIISDTEETYAIDIPTRVVDVLKKVTTSTTYEVPFISIVRSLHDDSIIRKAEEVAGEPISPDLVGAIRSSSLPPGVSIESLLVPSHASLTQLMKSYENSEQLTKVSKEKTFDSLSESLIREESMLKSNIDYCNMRDAEHKPNLSPTIKRTEKNEIDFPTRQAAGKWNTLDSVDFSNHSTNSWGVLSLSKGAPSAREEKRVRMRHRKGTKGAMFEKAQKRNCLTDFERPSDDLNNLHEQARRALGEGAPSPEIQHEQFHSNDQGMVAQSINPRDCRNDSMLSENALSKEVDEETKTIVSSYTSFELDAIISEAKEEYGMDLAPDLIEALKMASVASLDSDGIKEPLISPHFEAKEAKSLSPPTQGQDRQGHHESSGFTDSANFGGIVYLESSNMERSGDLEYSASTFSSVHVNSANSQQRMIPMDRKNSRASGSMIHDYEDHLERIDEKEASTACDILLVEAAKVYGRPLPGDIVAALKKIASSSDQNFAPLFEHKGAAHFSEVLGLEVPPEIVVALYRAMFKPSEMLPTQHSVISALTGFSADSANSFEMSTLSEDWNFESNDKDKLQDSEREKNLWTASTKETLTLPFQTPPLPPQEASISSSQLSNGHSGNKSFGVSLMKELRRVYKKKIPLELSYVLGRSKALSDAMNTDDDIKVILEECEEMSGMCLPASLVLALREASVSVRSSPANSKLISSKMMRQGSANSFRSRSSGMPSIQEGSTISASFSQRTGAEIIEVDRVPSSFCPYSIPVDIAADVQSNIDISTIHDSQIADGEFLKVAKRSTRKNSSDVLPEEPTKGSHSMPFNPKQSVSDNSDHSLRVESFLNVAILSNKNTLNNKSINGIASSTSLTSSGLDQSSPGMNGQWNSSSATMLVSNAGGLLQKSTNEIPLRFMSDLGISQMSSQEKSKKFQVPSPELDLRMNVASEQGSVSSVASSTSTEVTRNNSNAVSTLGGISLASTLPSRTLPIGVNPTPPIEGVETDDLSAIFQEAARRF